MSDLQEVWLEKSFGFRGLTTVVTSHSSQNMIQICVPTFSFNFILRRNILTTDLTSQQLQTAGPTYLGGSGSIVVKQHSCIG